MDQFKRAFLALLRATVTLVAVALAAWAGWHLWIHYQIEPWTRDGRVRADVVEIAPDVSGLVTQVAVANDQVVTRGQVLFTIDHDRFALAVQEADAVIAARQAALAEAKRESARDSGLGALVAREIVEQAHAKIAEDEALLAQAEAARAVAALNLARTTITAPVDGTLSEVGLRVGDYVAPGKPVMALIDSTSFRVEGYFEETKLPRLRIGAPVDIALMGEKTILHGHIDSIAAAIEDRERAPSATLLPNVNPTFSWVRLAQRIPVRITLDKVPADVRLIAGRTASVTIVEKAGAAK